ncbi:hypothetical protein [Flavobacterium fluviatile]|uniref:hypothetical protein n=1 Tax=Flavobacterium fluviatile TaxID=1862387 RepID=UPI0013D4810A|nr:hypothetical protein [Flavobacterium fluviatile]
MKRKLLYLTTVLLFSVGFINAQTKVWDFGNDRTNWPLDATGVSANKVVDLLGLFPGASSGNFGKLIQVHLVLFLEMHILRELGFN